jgi:acetyl-CoA carboxylase biotin carboxyl carrier protein
VATSAGGLGVAPEARGASGAFTAITDDGPAADNRIPVLAPLVGTFYRAAQPGSKPFAEVGDVVEVGQTVCIVEAMKLMNEVSAGEGGKVAEILVEDGDPVEFEQVLMYLEPEA